MLGVYIIAGFCFVVGVIFGVVLMAVIVLIRRDKQAEVIITFRDEGCPRITPEIIYSLNDGQFVKEDPFYKTQEINYNLLHTPMTGRKA